MPSNAIVSVLELKLGTVLGTVFRYEPDFVAWLVVDLGACGDHTCAQCSRLGVCDRVQSTSEHTWERGMQCIRLLDIM